MVDVEDGCRVKRGGNVRRYSQIGEIVGDGAAQVRETESEVEYHVPSCQCLKVWLLKQPPKAGVSLRQFLVTRGHLARHWLVATTTSPASAVPRPLASPFFSSPLPAYIALHSRSRPALCHSIHLPVRCASTTRLLSIQSIAPPHRDETLRHDFVAIGGFRNSKTPVALGLDHSP